MSAATTMKPMILPHPSAAASAPLSNPRMKVRATMTITMMESMVQRLGGGPGVRPCKSFGHTPLFLRAALDVVSTAHDQRCDG